MFLYAKEKIINLDTIQLMRVQDTKIQIDFKTGNGTKVAEYDSHGDAIVALKIICNEMYSGKDIILVPDSNRIQAENANNRTIHRNINGAKTHGKGGT